MVRALVLNSTDEPLCVVSTRRAVVLVLKRKAELVEGGEGLFHSERLNLEIPSVIRLKHYVRVPYRARASLSRRGVFVRDDHQCQYCGGTAQNLDHVIPRSRGGAHIWENVVAACIPCNTRKEDRLPKECGMDLRRKPVSPRERVWLIVAVGTIEPTWEPYLGSFRSAKSAFAPASA